MLRAEGSGDRRRVLAFIEGRFGEPNREGADALRGEIFARPPQNRTRIETAAEEESERHVTEQASSDGFAQQRTQLLDEFAFGAALKAIVRRNTEAPIAGHSRFAS